MQASVHTSSSITAAAAVISNKPVLYMPEKEGKMPNQPNLVKAATPVVKKPKVEPKPAAPAPPPVVSVSSSFYFFQQSSNNFFLIAFLRDSIFNRYGHGN